jgi:hypothetical protein
MATNNAAFFGWRYNSGGTPYGFISVFGTSGRFSLMPDGGNVGIGTSTVNSKFIVVDNAEPNTSGNITSGTQFAASISSGLASLNVGAYDNGSTIRYGYLRTAFSDAAQVASEMRFYTGPTERMRITSAGNVLINQTSVNSVGVSEITYNGQTQVGFCIKSSHVDGFNTRFLNQTNGIVGSIYSTTSATTYNTSSDYRLKEDFKEINGLEKISAIKVYDFKWKVDDSRMNGVIAHELAEVLPYAVVGEKDAEDENGNIIPQGVDYSLLTQILIIALQEAMIRVEELEAKFSALENKS